MVNSVPKGCWEVFSCLGDRAWKPTSLLEVTRYQQADSFQEEGAGCPRCRAWDLTHGNKRLSTANTDEGTGSQIGTVCRGLLLAWASYLALLP